MGDINKEISKLVPSAFGEERWDHGRTNTERQREGLVLSNGSDQVWRGHHRASLGTQPACRSAWSASHSACPDGLQPQLHPAGEKQRKTWNWCHALGPLTCIQLPIKAKTILLGYLPCALCILHPSILTDRLSGWMYFWLPGFPSSRGNHAVFSPPSSHDGTNYISFLTLHKPKELTTMLLWNLSIDRTYFPWQVGTGAFQFLNREGTSFISPVVKGQEIEQDRVLMTLSPWIHGLNIRLPCYIANRIPF